MATETEVLHPRPKRAPETRRMFRPLAFATGVTTGAAAIVGAIHLLTARDQGPTVPTQVDKPNPTPQIGQLIENPTPAPLAVSVEPFASPTVTETPTLIPTLTPTEVPPSPTATATIEATKAPKVVERRILYNSKDAKPMPLGITEEGWNSLGANIIQVSGFISKQVYEENGDLFFGLSTPDPMNPSNEIELQVFLTKQSMLESNRVGTSATINRTVTVSPTGRGRLIAEVIPYLKEGEQVILKIIDGYRTGQLDNILNSPTCDDSCQQRLLINAAHAAETQKTLNRIKNQTINEDPLIVGPISIITMDFDQ